MFRVNNNYIVKTDIEEILQKLRLVLTNGKLSNFRRTSSGISVPCPHHAGGQESHNSCYITDDGIFHCFTCGTSGNFVKFVQECFDCSREYAEEWLITNFGELSAHSINIDLDVLDIKNKQKKIFLDKNILENFQDWCPYFAKRGLSAETCKKYNLKYDPIYRQVIFPCYDARGHLLMLAKRSIDTKTFYLDKNIEKPVYCLNTIINNNCRSAIITEGPFDCLLANQYGFPACATLGNISKSQIEQINKSSLKIIYTMFDNDEAGRNFAKIIEHGVARNILVVDIKIPKGKKDIGELSYEEFWNILNTYGITQQKSCII